MSTSIIIMSPVPEDRANKAVAKCLARVAALGAEAPSIDVQPDLPDLDASARLISDGDEEVLVRFSEIQSIMNVKHDRDLDDDPILTECLRFLIRRSGQGLVQFSDALVETEVALSRLEAQEGVESFDEREEARQMQTRLLAIKYRLLTQRWKRGDAAWAPRALGNHEIEEHERSARLKFPPEFRGYLAVVGVGPGPSSVGILPLDELEKPQTYRKTAGRPKLGKTVHVGNLGSEHYHLLVTDGELTGTVWDIVDGTLGDEPIADSFLAYVEDWIGEGEPEPLACPACTAELDVQDLDREYCKACGTRRGAKSEQSSASQAFEEFASDFLERLLHDELLEIDDPGLMIPLVTGLTDYMGEKGHKWKSPDRAAASIAGWLLHRDEVAELHGTNADVARVFISVSRQ